MQTQASTNFNKQTKRKRTSSEWVGYFHSNRQSLIPIPWEHSYALTRPERILISDSIRIFQLGENSEGKNLLKAGERFAVKEGDPEFVNALRLFIAEEQRHAGYLAKFMQQQRIPLAKHHWTDLIFRTLRRMWNLEVCIAVLLAAELVAKVYYRALRACTESPVLRQVCAQLLCDEVQHVYFHTDSLARLRKLRRPGYWSRFLDRFYGLFFRVTLLAVWFGHAKVFRAGGFPFGHFWRTAVQHLHHALDLVAQYLENDGSPETILTGRRVIHGMKSLPSLRTFHDRITLDTNDCMQFIDLTDRIAQIIGASGIENGIINIQTCHTTTAILVNENEPLLLEDMRQILESIAPQCREYRHNDFSIRTMNIGPDEDQNGHSHCKSMFLRTAETLNLVEGKMELGRWQRIFLLELDKSRQRTVSVMILGVS